MKTQNYVYCICEISEHKLATEINRFGELHDTFATQIYDRGKYWVAFVHYRVRKL